MKLKLCIFLLNNLVLYLVLVIYFLVCFSNFYFMEEAQNIRVLCSSYLYNKTKKKKNDLIHSV